MSDQTPNEPASAPVSVANDGSESAPPWARNPDRVLIWVALGLVGLTGLFSWLLPRPGSQTNRGDNLAGSAAAATMEGRRRQLIDFSLTECNGQAVTRQDLQGKILVVSFVFTGCSLNCRSVNNRMEEIQGRIRRASDVRLVSITVDPRSDSPSALAQFAAGYHADTNHWWFLTGNKAEVYGVLETCFLSKSQQLAGTIPGGFRDTDRIMLVDPTGTVRGSFAGTSPQAPDEIMKGIAYLRAEKDRK